MFKVSRQFRILMTVLVLLLFVGYFLLNTSKFRPLLAVNFYLLALIALLDFLIMASNGLFTMFIMRPFGKYISLVESIYVSLISSVGNFFAPIGAGFGFRAVYLKKKHNFAYSDYISTLVGNYIIVFLVSSLLGLTSLFLLRGRADSEYMALVVVFVAIFFFGLSMSLVKIPHLKWGKDRVSLIGKICRNLHRVTIGWNHITSHKKLMLQLAGLTLFNLALTTVTTWLIIQSLHLHISLAPLLLFSVLGSLSLFINITPANLGIKEAIYIFSSSVLGFSTAQVLSIALIDRGVMFLVLAGLWVISHKLKSPSLEVELADQPKTQK